MVFMVLTRSGFDEVFPRLVKDRDALWVNAGVLSAAEVDAFARRRLESHEVAPAT